MSKKARREYYAQKRGSWNGVHPATQIAPNKKAVARKMGARKKDATSSERSCGVFSFCAKSFNPEKKGFGELHALPLTLFIKLRS